MADIKEGAKVFKGPHNVILENRKKLILTGVEDVDSFDEQTVVAYTSLGELTIKGEKLHVNKLSTESGELNIEGEVSSMVYSENQSGNVGFFAKLFR